MGEKEAVVLIALLRSLSTIAAITGAAYLAYHDKEGWGWMIFLAVFLGGWSVKFD